MAVSNKHVLEELSSSGLLWLINATVFHPRGFALALVYRAGQDTNWTLLGDGSEPWHFLPADAEEKFAAAQATLERFRQANTA